MTSGVGERPYCNPSLSVTHCKSCGSLDLAPHSEVRRNKDERLQVAIVNLHNSFPNKMLLSKGIAVSKLLCFVDFPISSFSLTDKALFKHRTF